MRRVEEDQQTIEKLPDDIWAKILSHLNDKYDWESLSLTSHKFLSLTNSSRISLSFLRIKNEHILSRLLKRFPNVRKLRITSFLRLDDTIDLFVILIAQSSLNLDKLDLLIIGSLQTVYFEGLGSRVNLKVLKLWFTVTNADLIRIADTFPLLEKIRIGNFVSEGVEPGVPIDEGIHYLSSKLKRLRSVDIFYAWISDKSLVSLVSNCAFLEHFTLDIDFDVPIGVTENGISFLAKNCPHLKSLFIIGRLKMDCFGDKSPPNLSNNLQTLKLENLVISDKFLFSITEARISLTHFHLNRCQGYSFNGIWKLLNSYRSLKTLVLRFVEFLTNEHIDKLSSFLHNLTTIHLHKCPLISDSAFVMLTQRCPLLCDITMSRTSLGKEEYHYDGLNLKKNFAVKYLTLPMNVYLSTSPLCRLLSICPKVETLYLSQSFISNVLDVADVLECSRELLELAVGYCRLKFTRKDMEVSRIRILVATYSDINDEVLVELAKICPRLLHLRMRSCKNVTDEGVKEVVKSCKQLRSLYLGESMNVNTGLTDWIESNYPSVTQRVSI